MSDEYIIHEASDPDAWHCLCGNTPVDDGFYSCDVQGNEMEPALGSDWNGLYVCAKCGRIIDQSTLRVVGRNQHPVWLS